MFNKKYVSFIVIALMLVLMSSAAFAATAPERYTVTIKGLDVYNPSYVNSDGTTGAWFHLTHATNAADVVYINGNSSVQSWFNTSSLVPGTYTRMRLIIGNDFTIRGHYVNGATEYFTKPGVPGKAVEYTANVNAGTGYDPKAFPSSADVTTGPLTDPTLLTNALAGSNVSTVKFNDTVANGGSPSYAQYDIIYRLNGANFTLAAGDLKNLVVTMNIDNTMVESGFTAADCNVDFQLPKVQLSIQ